MAWPWISIIALLTCAYYGIYIYATALKKSDMGIKKYQHVAGWIAAIFFLIIGFIFSNEFSLMTNIYAWPSLWRSSNFAGAVTGMALNITDPTFLPRWLMMFGLAITTTSAFIGLDAGLFSRKESDDYRRWVPGFAFKAYFLGILWFGLFAVWYMFVTWGDDVRHLMFSGTMMILTITTGAAVLLPFGLLFVSSRKGQISKRMGILIGLAQFLVLALNAVSRQIVQNAELSRYLDITAEKVNTQWSPMILFLLIFAAGVGLMIWMISQAVKSNQASPTNIDAE
jgi:hypothetical protein